MEPAVFLNLILTNFSCAAPSGKSIKIMLTWSEFYNQFSLQLNEQQQSAVQSLTGPVLLLAVPGSGKTTVLVTRLGYMIFCRGIAPEKILTVTYTVAATKDMSERFASRFGQDLADRLEICRKHTPAYDLRQGDSVLWTENGTDCFFASHG